MELGCRLWMSCRIRSWVVRPFTHLKLHFLSSSFGFPGDFSLSARVLSARVRQDWSWVYTFNRPFFWMEYSRGLLKQKQSHVYHSPTWPPQQEIHPNYIVVRKSSCSTQNNPLLQVVWVEWGCAYFQLANEFVLREEGDSVVLSAWS